MKTSIIANTTMKNITFFTKKFGTATRSKMQNYLVSLIFKHTKQDYKIHTLKYYEK